MSAARASARVTMTAFVAKLKRDYPDEAFLIVRFGDHPPAIAPRLLEPKMTDEQIAEGIMNRDPRFFSAYYAIDAINFTPVDLSSARDALDAPYLPLMIQEAAGLPLDSTFAEQKRFWNAATALFYPLQGRRRGAALQPAAGR